MQVTTLDENFTTPSMFSYGRHLFICVHGDCAGADAGMALSTQIQELNRAHSLNKLRNPHRVKCSMVDCMGVCQGGPIVAIYPDGIWYHHVNAQVLERIYREHILDNRPVDEFIFHRQYPSGEEPAYAPAVRGDMSLTAAQELFAPASQSSSLSPSSSSSSALPVEAEPQDQDCTAVERRASINWEEADWEEVHGGTGEYSSAAPLSGDVAGQVEQAPLDADQANARRVEARRNRRKKGLIIVNTGTGKGKTTAALGILMRAWGRKMRIGMLQFLKNDHARFGEIRAAEQMGRIDWLSAGDGWTWTSKDMDETIAKARAAWQMAQTRILSGEYDLFILDEFTYPLHYGWLDTGEVVAWLERYKPPMLHLIITGRYAPPPLIEFADLVTEMRAIKHPLSEQGIRAQAGIEY